MSDKSIRELIDASSLGTESAQSAIDSVSPEHGRLIVAIAEQRAKTEALAKHLFRFGNPNLTGEEHDRLLGMWEEVDDMVRTVWLDLADAAYIHLADEIDSAVEQHTNGRITEPETTSEGGKRWYVNGYASVEFDAACDIWLNEVDPYVGDSGHARKLAAALHAAATAADELRAALEGES